MAVRSCNLIKVDSSGCMCTATGHFWSAGGSSRKQKPRSFPNRPANNWRAPEIASESTLEYAHALQLMCGRAIHLQSTRSTYPMDSTTVHILLVVFLATLIRSTFGFGEALVAVPIACLARSIEIAAPLTIPCPSPSRRWSWLVQDWRKIHLHSSTWLLLPDLRRHAPWSGAACKLHQRLVKGALAIVIMAFSGYS